MSGHDPLAPVARLARRIPGYPRARRVLVPRVRRNVMLRAIAHKLWVTEVAVDGRGADLTAGKLIEGVDTHTLPVILFVLPDVSTEQQELAADQIAAIQVLTAGFRPVFVFPQPDFGPARRHGYPAELLPASRRGGDLVEYWQRLRDTYGSVLICEIAPEGLSSVQRSYLLSMVHGA